MNNKKSILLILSFILIYGCKENGKTVETERENWWLWTANWNKNQISVGGTQDTLRLFSSETYQLADNIPLRGTITKTKWHPIKNKLAISMQDEKSKSLILDPISREQIVLDSLDESGARAIGWNNKGELLAVGDYSGFLNIYNESGGIVKRIKTNQKGLIGLDWHPEKNIITVVGERISIYDFENDSIYDFKPRKEDVLILCVAWNPNGEFFVTGDYGDFEKAYPPLLQFWSVNGENLRNIDKSKSEFRNIKWSKDGKILATASESLRLWNENGDLLKESESENLLWGIDWNKSDNKIVTTDEKGKIIIWDKELNQIQELKY
jgi:WD40 repeat protein